MAGHIAEVEMRPVDEPLRHLVAVRLYVQAAQLGRERVDVRRAHVILAHRVLHNHSNGNNTRYIHD